MSNQSAITTNSVSQSYCAPSSRDDIDAALERWRNSDGFACSAKDDPGVVEDLMALAQLADDLESGDSESLRIAKVRIADLENGLTTLHLQFGEPYYSWQRVLYRVQQLIRRRNACAEACLNALGYLQGGSVLNKETLAFRLTEAVKPLVGGSDELPAYHQEVDRIRSAEERVIVADTRWAHWADISDAFGCVVQRDKLNPSEWIVADSGGHVCGRGDSPEVAVDSAIKRLRG